MSLVMPNGNPQIMQQGNLDTSVLDRGVPTDETRKDAPDNRAPGGPDSQGPWNDFPDLSSMYERDENGRLRPKFTPPAGSAGDTGKNGSGSGTGTAGSTIPGVPPSFQNPNSPVINSQFKAQNIRDFTGKTITRPTYTPTQMSQFSDPRNMQVQQGRDDLLLQQLLNPESMSQTWQDQVFEQQKDDANSWAKQMGLANQQQAVGMGRSLGSGWVQDRNQNTQNELTNQLLAGRRSVATQAATQNFADRMGVLSAAENGLNADVDRLGAIFQSILAGQQAQAGENQFSAQFGLNSQLADAANERDNYASYLSGRSLQDQSNVRQEQFGQSAFGLSNQSRQNDRQAALNEWMAANNIDLGWANYGLTADGQFLNYLSNFTG